MNCCAPRNQISYPAKHQFDQIFEGIYQGPGLSRSARCKGRGMLWELRAGAWRTCGLGVVEFTKTFRGSILRQWTRERKLLYYNRIYIGVIVGWTLKHSSGHRRRSKVGIMVLVGGVESLLFSTCALGARTLPSNAHAFIRAFTPPDHGGMLVRMTQAGAIGV